VILLDPFENRPALDVDSVYFFRDIDLVDTPEYQARDRGDFGQRTMADFVTCRSLAQRSAMTGTIWSPMISSGFIPATPATLPSPTSKLKRTVFSISS
jgi:hypothetical protein